MISKGKQDPSTTDYLYNLYKGNEEQLKDSEDLFSQQDMVKLIRFYTEKDVPDNLAKKEPYKTFWAILGKAPILTFLKDEDEETYDSLFRLSKLKFLLSKPSYTYTFESQDAINQLRIYFKSAVKRAIGADKNRINERTMEQTQINQIMRTNLEGFNAPQKSGFLGKISKMM